METKAQIGKWGNSLAFRIPKHISEYLGLKPNDTVICSVERGKLVLEPVQNPTEYTLDELLAGETEPDEEVSWGKPEGEEVW